MANNRLGNGRYHLQADISAAGPVAPLTWFNLIPACTTNYMPSNVWDEITYPFLNFNGCTVEV